MAPHGRKGRNSENHWQGKGRNATTDSNTLEEQCHPRKVFIGGLCHKTTTPHLRDYFGRFGPIADAVVLRWPDGRSRGFGYVTFADSNSAEAVMKETHVLSEREVDVKRAVPGTNKLFVGGLPQNTAASELREHFEKFGIVSDAVVMIDAATNRSRGFGFVCFLPGQEGSDAVAAVLAEYDSHHIRGKWIEVKSAAPPHKLAAQEGQQTGKARKSSEEMSLSCALGHTLDKEPSTTRADLAKLGSPQKVELPSRIGVSMKSPPGFTETFGAAFPTNWPTNPWLSQTGLGYDDSSQASAAHIDPWGIKSSNVDLGQKSAPLYTDLSPAASLQRNLELYVRQTMEQKLDW